MIRRDFFKYSFVSAALLTTSNINAKQINTSTIKTKVAICGGGFAGLSCAKHLKELNKDLDVTVIEKRANFSSCPLSNAWLGEALNISYEDLNYDFNSAILKYNYNFINETIKKINKDKKQIITSNHIIEYEYLIMAVGIDYDYEKLFKDINKIKECKLKAPAGLKPGSEQLALKRMIKNFKGGNFVISIPNGTYKCPPAPYERACMIANYFKKHNIKAKVIVLDPREKPAAKPKKFLEAFETFYKDIIVYKPYSNFKDIDFKTKKIVYEEFNKEKLEYLTLSLEFEEANIIPPNKANELIKKANLATYENGWAKLRQPTFRSISSEDVYIIGDSQGEYAFPKSAQMANSTAYLVAQELIDRINNKKFNYKENLPGNICYSMITDNKAVSISHLYEYKDTFKANSFTSKIQEDIAIAAQGWYFGLIEDILGIKS